MPSQRFKGRIHYVQSPTRPDMTRTFLDLGDGDQPALAIDNPPLGITNLADFAAATDHFRDFLQIPQEGGITVEGHRARFGTLAVIQVTRVVRGEVL